MKIHELIEKTGLSRRTIYYYIQVGLLPPPRGRGKSYEYGKDHLQRIQIIKRLQRFHLPLSEIKGLLEAYSLPEIEQRFIEERPEQLRKALHAFRLHPRPLSGERWVRISLTGGVELHVRLPLSMEAKVLLRDRFHLKLDSLLEEEKEVDL